MTVRDVNLKYPQAYPVFEKYGIAGCGGKFGPPESLNFFAQAHKVNVDQLIEDLQKAIEGEPVETVVLGADRVIQESTLYRGFIRAAIIFALTGGAAFGMHLLADIHLGDGFRLDTLKFAQAHANVQLYGWIGLFILGFAYHAIPRFKNAQLRLGGTASLSLILIIASLATRFVGQSFLDRGAAFGGLLVSSGILLLLGYGAFVLSMIVTVRRAESETEFYEKFIVASLVWGLVSVVLNLAALLQMVDGGSALLPPETKGLLRHVQFYGFIALMVIGVSYRLLPGFLGIDTANSVVAGWVFALFNMGIVLWIVAEVTGNSSLSIAAYGIELIAAVMAVISLKIFQPQRAAIEIVGEGPFFRWYIQLAYVWLLVALAMIVGGSLYRAWNLTPLTHSYLDAYRHAFAMGFVATIILGIAQRVLPVWEGKTVYSTRLMAAVFILVTVGNLLRFFFEAVGASGEGVERFLIAGGGTLEFIAILLFSYNVWKTLILHEIPEAAEILRKEGIRTLPDGPDGRSVPKFLTLERLCRTNDVDLEGVIRALETFLRESGRPSGNP
jgi:hypothetical protein